MRIAFVGSADPFLSVYPPGGGIENQIWGLSKKLVEVGHEVHILERWRGEGYRCMGGIHIHGVKTCFKDPFVSFLIFSRNAVKVIEKVKPDVMYLAERFTAYYPSKMNLPKIFVTHNRDAFDFYKEYALKTNKLNHVFFRLKRHIERGVMKRCDLICPLTPSLEGILHEMGFENTFILPNAINVKEYYNNGEDEKYIFYTGQLVKFKAVDLLIKAFNELPKEYDEYKLAISGTGSDEDRLRKIATESSKKDKIRFVGWVDRRRLLKLYSKCTVFVLPSLFETFSIVTLEAMASGKPVVASKVIGPMDLVKHGETGYLFEKGDVDELGRYLEVLLSDEGLRRKMGSEARVEAERYDFEAISRRLEDAFSHIIDRLTIS